MQVFLHKYLDNMMFLTELDKRSVHSLLVEKLLYRQTQLYIEIAEAVADLRCVES